MKLGTCRGKAVCRAWEMRFPMRPSKAALQARATLAEPAGGRGVFVYKQKVNPKATEGEREKSILNHCCGEAVENTQDVYIISRGSLGIGI